MKHRGSKRAKDLIENENPKPVWNFVKSKRKGTNKLISLKVGNSMLTNYKCIADSMNTYFSKIYRELMNPVLDTQILHLII